MTEAGTTPRSSDLIFDLEAERHGQRETQIVAGRPSASPVLEISSSTGHQRLCFERTNVVRTLLDLFTTSVGGTTMRNFVLCALFSAALLSGCAGEPAGGPGTYSVESNGVALNVTVPASGTSELVSAIEAYRQKVGSTAEFVYLSQELVNAGDAAANPCPSPRVVTEDGQTVKFVSAFQAVGDLQDLVAQGDTALYNEGVELYNALLGSKALPGATTTSLYVATSPLPSIKSVFSGVATGDTLPIQVCEGQLTKVEVASN